MLWVLVIIRYTRDVHRIDANSHLPVCLPQICEDSLHWAFWHQHTLRWRPSDSVVDGSMTVAGHLW
jgi:hypothetical protein